MDKKYSVTISNTALEMLKEHILFLAKIDKNAARKLKERLISSFDSLQDMPNRFPFFNEEYITPNKYHKMYVENWYLVLYQIKDNDVYVEYILDCRKNYEWLL